MKRSFKWDGEKIVETKSEELTKHSSKDILNGLAGVRGQIGQMEGQASQLKQQLELNNKNLLDAKKFEKELSEFEEGCVTIQKDKLKMIVASISEDCKLKALKSSELVIGKDPSAYTEDQKKNLAYLDFQKLLGTNEKVSEKISSQIIKEFLYDTPCFENPFKE